MSLVSYPQETCSADERPSRADEDAVMAAARGETAGLLAIAYRRLKAITRVGSGEPGNPGENELANARLKSVHGVVQ